MREQRRRASKADLDKSQTPEPSKPGTFNLVFHPFRGGNGVLPHDSQRAAVSDELLAQTVRDYLSSYSGPLANFTWQCAESPNPGVRFFQRVVELQKEHSPESVTCANTLLTSGQGLDLDTCRFLAEHNFDVAIELNGPSRLHDDLHRLTGKGVSFSTAYRALKRLQRTGARCRVRCSITSVNSGSPLEVYSFLREEGVRVIEFSPCVEHVDEDRLSPWSVDPESFGEFLTRIFDEWVSHDAGRIHVQHFDAAMESFRGCTSSFCVHAGTCGANVSVQAGGDIFSCEEYLESGHYLGNIRTQGVHRPALSPFQQRFGAEKQDALPGYCRECPVLFACNGGCPKHRFALSPYGEPGLNYLCSGYKTFFTHIAPFMTVIAMMLENELPLSLVSQTLRESGYTGG